MPHANLLRFMIATKSFRHLREGSGDFKLLENNVTGSLAAFALRVVLRTICASLVPPSRE